MRATFIKLIIIGGLFSISLQSCNDLLEPVIYNQINPGNFPQTEDDIKGLLTSVYTVFNSTGGNNESDWTFRWSLYARHYSWWLISEATTDAMYNRWYAEFPFNWGSAFDTPDIYNKIKTVSQATDYIHLIENSPVSEELKENSIAQLKCLRAWILFILYDFYGPVPAVVNYEELIPPIHFKARPSDEVYLGWIVKDLEEAIEVLPVKTNTDPSRWGEVNQGVARMLLMKTYMNTKQWTKAKLVCEELMDMKYTLQENYKSVFNTSKNNEVIYAIPTTVANGGHGWYYYLMPDAPNVTACGVTSPVNGWWGFAMNWDFYDTYSPGDIRLETIGSEYTASNTVWVTDEDGNRYESHLRKRGDEWLQDGAIAMKYIFQYEDEQAVDKTDLVVFRYADVLLSRAEIEVQLSGNPESGKNYLKEVTDRANTVIPDAVWDGKDNFMEFLLAERGRELYFEGWRRMDLIRFGKFISWGQSKGLNAQDYMVKFPIPPSVVNESGGIVEPNPGY